MSDFVRHNAVATDFATSDSWVILSPIEQSIKRKIEAIGVPLKDWNINIYRGVLTGYNEAFIISTEKRNEILNNCQNPEERQRTEELIRPILRGRDIKRYGYDWANLWLINTHNGIKGKLDRIHIEDYPAVKAQLDQYWDKISTRADKGDTPYNLRNCAYLDDFNKPKIIWKIIGSNLAFALDNERYIVNNACYLMTGAEIESMLPYLNSRIINWYSDITNMNPTGVGDAQVGAQNIIQFPIPKPNSGTIIDCVHRNIFEIENEVAKVYGITTEELNYILSMYPISSLDKS